MGRGQPGSVSKFPPFLWVKLWVGWVGGWGGGGGGLGWLGGGGLVGGGGGDIQKLTDIFSLWYAFF